MEPAEKSYNKLKTNLDQIRYEFTNQDSVALRKSGNFYKAVHNSAVMLKMLGAKTKLRSVYNQSFHQEIIEMSIHSAKITETKEYLTSLSNKILRDDEVFFIVRLKQPFSAKHIKAARNSEKVRTEVAEHVLTAGKSNTQLANEVRSIYKEISILVRSMKNPDSSVLSYILMQETIELQRIIRTITRTKDPTREMLQAADDAADDLQGTLLLVPNFVQEANRLTKIGRSLYEIRTKCQS